MITFNDFNKMKQKLTNNQKGDKILIINILMHKM